MKKKQKKQVISILSLLFGYKVINSLRFMRAPILNDSGWWASLKAKRPQDTKGNPLPWFSYAAIFFLKQKNLSDLSVFEYGAGNSTHFWSARVKSVHAVESNTGWYEALKKEVPGNVTLTYGEGEEYINCIANSKKNFDIVVIDGILRLECSKVAVHHLSDRGVIIVDNSDREAYQGFLKDIQDSGFKRLDFWGLTPMIFDTNCTTVFYREGNCLDI